MANLTINFTTPPVPPAGGYLVKYRKTGQNDYTTVSPNPTASPVVITGIDSQSAYDGTIQAVCSMSSNSDVVTFNVGSLATLDRFDYMVIRYRNNGGGLDMDTFTGFVDTGTPYDISYANNTNWVGFSGPGNVVPTDANNVPSPYLRWAGDNLQGGGVEAVLIDFKKFLLENTNLPSIVKVRLHSWWYGTRGNGDINVELQTWKEGNAPVLDAPNYDFVKQDGQQVDLLTRPAIVTCGRAENSGYDNVVRVGCGQRISEIVYDTINKTASLVEVTGGCNCLT